MIYVVEKFWKWTGRGPSDVGLRSAICFIKHLAKNVPDLYIAKTHKVSDSTLGKLFANHCHTKTVAKRFLDWEMTDA